MHKHKHTAGAISQPDRSKMLVVFLGIALVTCVFNKQANAASLLCEAKLAEAAVPKTAFYLPENQAFQLQKTLDNYKIVRLAPGGNYSKSFKIKLGSNQAIYGLAGTKLPQVIIPEGTSNAILSNVSPENISFEGFTKPSTANCFIRISDSKIIAKNALLENNLFVDLSRVTIDIDNSQKGYLKNNRFIRTMVHGAYPAIKIIGDNAKQSQDNLFIWSNILTPLGDGIIIKNQKSLGFIGIDSESWNWGQIAEYPAMMNVLNTDFLSVFMSNGGDHKNNNGQYFNLDAKNIVLQGMHIDPSQKPGIILGNSVDKFLAINTQNIGLKKAKNSTQVIDFFSNSAPTITENAQALQPEKLPSKTKNTITSLLKYENSLYSNWQKPTFSPIPDPAGSNWQTNLSKQPDSADSIQALIDKDGIVELEAGIYYISKPLLLKDGQGIIGAGADKTAIIAKSPAIDLIAGATHFNVNITTTSFVLADLTLQGGRNGINHSATGSGQGADYNLINLSHVTFRNMTNAGISIDNIYAWDNNFIDHTNFYRCKTGIKQRPDPAYVGGEHIGMTFLDKNVFYQTQFIENDVALDLQAKRGNYLDAFINCLFKNNGQAISLNNAESAFFANSVFETASQKPLLIANRVTGFVNSYFSSKQPIPTNSLFGYFAYCNHCNFENSSGLIVSPNSLYSFFINNTLSKAANQTIDTGLILNSTNFSNNLKKPISNTLFNKRTAHPF